MKSLKSLRPSHNKFIHSDGAFKGTTSREKLTYDQFLDYIVARKVSGLPVILPQNFKE